jgi:flagellar hook-associated protein 2
MSSISPVNSNPNASTSSGSTTGSNSSTQTAQQTAQQVLQQIGIGSTLPITQVLSGLMQIESIPLTQLQNQVTGVQTEISAYGQLSSALATFQQSLTQLTLPTQFKSLTASVANTSVLSASAVYGAQTGTYTVNVTQLAQSQTLVAAGQASLNSSLLSGSGPATVSIAFGTQSGTTFTSNAQQPGGTITIDSSNDTLSGLRDAINAANLGVTASIVNDGSSTPYRLVLTSNSTGANESMQITVSGDTGLASAIGYPPPSGTPASQQMTQTVAAQDAQLTVNGLALSSTTNTIASALPGLSLTLAQTGSTTMTVASDTSSIQKNIDNFVSAYTTLQASLQQLTAYNPSGTNGPLIGDATTMQIQSQLSRIVASALTGTGTSGYTTLAQVGITLNADGSLSVDDSKLSSALASNPTQFASLFGTAGSTSNSNVTYLIGGANTQQGNYAVNITQAATTGTATGSTAFASQSLSGTQLTVTLNGVSADVTVPDGNYTADTLATALQAAINTNSTFQAAGLSANVTNNGGVLTLANTAYGSNSTVAIGGASAAAIFGSSITQTAGKDVQGTIGGYAATGTGQVLTASAGAAAGLQIQVAGSQSGSLGTVSYSQGYASQLNALVTSVTGSSGAIASATNTLNSQVSALQQQETSTQAYINQVYQTYQTQFTALSAALVKLQSTSSFLQQTFNPTTTTG